MPDTPKKGGKTINRTPLPVIVNFLSFCTMGR